MTAKQILRGDSLLVLRLKIIVGYVTLLALLGVIVALVWTENGKMEALNNNELLVNRKREAMNRTFEKLLEFSFYGDFPLLQDSDNFDNYRTKLEVTTGVLNELKQYYPTDIQRSRIDKICSLLREKEELLLGVINTLSGFSRADSLLQEKIPVIASQAQVSQQPDKSPTPEDKRSGFLDLFKKKEEKSAYARKMEQRKQTSQTHFSSTRGKLYSLQQEVHAQYTNYWNKLAAYSDSLQEYNSELNLRISGFIREFESEATRTTELEHVRTISGRECSFRTISLTVIVAVLLVVVFYIVIHRDITQKDTYRKRLEASDRKNKSLLDARNRMMLAMSHELRAPLTTIQGYAELLPSERKKENRVRYACAVLQSSEWMLSLLNTLLDFYRLDVGKEQVDTVPFSLCNLTESLETAYSLQAGKKGLYFTVEYEGDDLLLSGDRDRILRIGGNLLSNAIKYTTVGEVALHLYYEKGALHLKVSDTGTGMSEEEQHRVFEPFERLCNAGMQEGFGMGLTITAGLVRLLQGKIHVESEQGRGTIFSVELPISVIDENPAYEKLSDTDISLSKYLRVAVVDNDAVLLAMTMDMFAAHHIHCEGCQYAGELMELLRKSSYDLLITDINMPGINGYQLLELLRASNVGNAREIPVLVATARVERTPEEFIAAGFVGCLYKPFSRTELLTAVRACLPERPGKLRCEADFSQLLSGEHNGKDMLRLLTEETRKDMTRLSDAADNGDKELVSLLIHHLLPLWKMVHIDSVLQELREVCSNVSATDKEIQDAVAHVVATGERMVRQAVETIK